MLAGRTVKSATVQHEKAKLVIWLKTNKHNFQTRLKFFKKFNLRTYNV